MCDAPIQLLRIYSSYCVLCDYLRSCLSQTPELLYLECYEHIELRQLCDNLVAAVGLRALRWWKGANLKDLTQADDHEVRELGSNMENERASGQEGEHMVGTDLEAATVDATATLLQLLMKQQRGLTEQQERSREQHQRVLDQQATQQEVLLRRVEQLREEMSAIRRRKAEAAGRSKIPKPTQHKLNDDEDDIENFLATFERIATQQKWLQCGNCSGMRKPVNMLWIHCTVLLLASRG